MSAPLIIYDGVGSILSEAEALGFDSDALELAISSENKAAGVLPDDNRAPGDPLAYFMPSDYDAVEDAAIDFLLAHGRRIDLNGEILEPTNEPPDKVISRAMGERWQFVGIFHGGGHD